MHLPLLKKRPRKGQALALACVAMLVMALMLMLSFNLSQALHEKIRLQQHSDALAYSMAIVEARSFNYYAASNRAMAASYSAMNSLHAYMVSASVTSAMMTAGQNNMYVIAAWECMIEGACWCCNIYCTSGCQHIPHMIGAIKRAGDYGDGADDYADKANEQDSKFEKAVEDLDKMIDEIHKSQMAVYDDTKAAVTSGTSSELSKLKTSNAPRSTDLNSSVGDLNGGEYDCAIDGMNCSRSGTDDDTHAKVMTEVGNATRSDWAGSRVMEQHLNSDFLDELKTNIPDDGSSTVLIHQGTAKTIESEGDEHGGGEGSSSDNTGKVSGADEHGMLYTSYECGMSVMPYEAKVYSDENGGSHEPDGAHDGDHNFEGVNKQAITSCSGNGNCFMKFRATSDADEDFGQPRVYSYVTQKLRQGTVTKAPWEINANAKIDFGMGAQGSGVLNLAPTDGVGFSKAMVYYHRLGGWQEHPNFFNAYWRAKLHPFKPAEAEKVLNAAGNSDAAELSGAANLPM